MLTAIKSFQIQSKGAVALEAMLSIVLLFIAFYCMWGAALVIYNQSKLNTATQFAAQSALVVFDRRTYRGVDNGRYEYASESAQRVAWSVFRENSCGMLPNQFTGEVPDDDCNTPSGSDPPGLAPISIQCAAELDGNYRASNCESGGYENAQALRVSAESSIISPFDLLSPFNGLGANKESNMAHLNSQANAFSYAGGGRLR